jgi:hypothetical protein
MDEGWVKMEMLNWHLHYRICCKLVINQTFEGGEHGLVAKKAKYGRLSTFERGP